MDDEIKQIDLLDHVFKRPSMYVGEAHLDRFECFMCGFSCGCTTKDRNKWWEFNDWVLKKLRHNPSSIRACGHIARKFGWKKRGMKELTRLWEEYRDQERIRETTARATNSK